MSLHPALARARRGRLAEEPLAIAPPQELWRLCEGDGKMYSHAMEEAGHVTHFAGDRVPARIDPCSYCGWTPLSASVAIVDYGTPVLAARCRRSIYDCQPRWLRQLRTVDAMARDLGYSEALARGLDVGSAPILIACNADVEFPPEGIEALLALFEERPRLGVLGPRQRNARGFIVHAGIEQLGDSGGGRSYGQVDQGQHSERFTEIEQVSGSIMLIRREALEQIGGFTDMPRLYYEDAILCLRLKRAGWEIGYSGAVTFLHHVAQSPSDARSRLAAEARAAFERELHTTQPQEEEHDGER